MHALSHRPKATADMLHINILREDCLKWVKDTLAKELKHYHAVDDSSKRGKIELELGCSVTD